jgi:hydrogenase maturation protease
VLVLGLGSPFLTDDSVGPRVVRELARHPQPGVSYSEAHAGGLLLAEEMAGFHQVVLVDALLDPSREPGEVVLRGLTESSRNAACGHDCTLPQALRMGREMGIPLPGDAFVHLVAVVAEDVTTFSEALSPRVEAALPRACDLVRTLLSRSSHA